MSAKNSKGLYVGAFGLFLLGVLYLMVTGISEGSMPFLNVAEALAMPTEKLQSARLFGTVKGEGLARMQKTPGVTFQLEDKDNPSLSLWVVFEGVVPETFKPGAEVIVEGTLPGDPDLSFKAANLMTKCPSKYQKENRS